MVYILLPVHNRKDFTRGFVECLLAQTIRDFHLVLIDDGSTDGTAEMVQEYIPTATVLRGSGNWWWGGSLQQGIDWLKRHQPSPSDVILTINDDVTFEPDFLERGLNFIQQHPDALLQSNFYDDKLGKVVEMGRSANFRHMSFPITGVQNDLRCLSTRGLFFSWDTCIKVGDFHPVLLPHYGSDSEYTFRAWKKGFSLRTSPEIYLKPFLDATGFREAGKGISPKEMFSKKCSINPVYWTTFIMLTFPIGWMPINIFKVWRRAIHSMLRWKNEERAKR